ncbi:MAG: protein kinase [Deltaproteobacteria bacterium]|nr:protein kinase [Deltaproteobacteria bacterium]
MEDSGGTTLRGRFRLQECIGQGAMGAVWRAHDLLTQELVAVKLLKTPNPAATSVFLREIETLAELRHPHIVGYVDHGLAESGSPYLAMQWLQGEDLQARLLRQCLTADEAIVLAEQALSALAVAHGRGIVHRDLKPANIFLCDGLITNIKLVDFGIATRVLAGATDRSQLAVGTPLYMSPEQARGLADIDGRSDFFSLGSVLYEAITGAPPFGGATSMAVLAKVCIDEPEPLRSLCPSVPAKLEELLGRMMAKLPSQRPQEAETLMHMFANLATTRTGEMPAFTDSLSMDEQRVVAVLMSSSRSLGKDWSLARPDQTKDVGTTPVNDLPETLKASLAQLDAQINQLVDGTLLITCQGKGTASELATSATRCALALRRHNALASTSMSLGKAVVRQGLPLGKLLDDTSSRLASTAPGAVSLDDDMASLLERSFEVLYAGDKWLLVDDITPTPAPVNVHAKERLFVGRSDELQHLTQLFAEVRQANAPRAVVWQAEAGVGKSRLASAALTHLGAHAEFLVWRAQSDTLQAATPLGYVRQLVMNAMSIQEDTPRKALREIVSRFMESGGTLVDVAQSCVYLCELLGAVPNTDSEHLLRPARNDPRLMAEQMAFAVGDALKLATARAPVVLLLDDLHWADAASIKLLGSALSQASACLVIALARPELSERYPSLWEGLAPSRRTLEPLSAEDAARLITQLLPSGGSTPAEWIAERADGNPFYIEELARAVRRRGKSQVPDAVLGTVQARLGDLPAPARRILRAASIFGRQFVQPALFPLLGKEDCDDLDRWLKFLIEEEVLQSTGRATYRFWHELTREATYQSLTAGDRVLGHKLAGRWLQDEGSTPPSVLLEHFTRAGDVPRACALAEAAANQAYGAGDLEGTLGFVSRAYGLQPDNAQLARLSLLEARALRWMGRLQDSWPPAQKAISLFTPNSADWYTAIECGAAVLGDSANAQTLMDLSFTALDGETIDDVSVDARAMALAAISGGLMTSEFLQHAETLLQEAETVDGALLRHETKARLAIIRGATERRWGRLGQARAHHHRALEEARLAGDELLEVEARNTLISTIMLAGLFDETLELLQPSLVFARRIRSRLFEALAAANVGIVNMYRDEVAAARQAYSEAAAALQGLGATWLDLGLGLFRAQLALMENDVESASRYVQPFAEDPQVARPLRPYALALTARVRMREGNSLEALRLAEEGRRMIDDEGVPVEDGEAYLRLTLCQALLAVGNKERAYQVLTHAVQKLQRSAETMGDEVLATAFLNIPEHQAIFAQHAEMTAQSQGAG